MNRCVFATRFKELYKEKGWTQQDVATRLDYGINTIRDYCRKDGRMPPIEVLGKMGEMFDVDIAYLIGEQDCRRHADQTICDVTHLTEGAASVLRGLNYLDAAVLSKFLTHPNFDKLIDNIFLYTLSGGYDRDGVMVVLNKPSAPISKDASNVIDRSRADMNFNAIIDDMATIIKKNGSSPLAVVYKIVNLYNLVLDNIIRFQLTPDDDDGEFNAADLRLIDKELSYLRDEYSKLALLYFIPFVHQTDAWRAKSAVSDPQKWTKYFLPIWQSLADYVRVCDDGMRVEFSPRDLFSTKMDIFKNTHPS